MDSTFRIAAPSGTQLSQRQKGDQPEWTALGKETDAQKKKKKKAKHTRKNPPLPGWPSKALKSEACKRDAFQSISGKVSDVGLLSRVVVWT